MLTGYNLFYNLVARCGRFDRLEIWNPYLPQ